MFPKLKNMLGWLCDNYHLDDEPDPNDDYADVFACEWEGALKEVRAKPEQLAKHVRARASQMRRRSWDK